MKKLLFLSFFLFLSQYSHSQTAIAAGEIRHRSFVALLEPESSTVYLQVARDMAFSDLVVDGQFIVTGYQNDPYNNNSPLRINGLTQGTTYYYRFSFQEDNGYNNIISVTTWDPPADPTPIQPDVNIYDVTINWTNADPEAAGHDIWVYIDGTACVDGDSYSQDNVISAAEGELSINYDFFFPEDASYLFNTVAKNEDGEYGTGKVTYVQGCDCYSEIDLATIMDDKEILVTSGGTSFRIRYSNGTNWSPTATERYLNYVWTMPEGWEMNNYTHFATSLSKGFADGNVTVKLVNPCTGATSDVLSVAVLGEKQDQTITFDALPEKTFGDDPFSLTAEASSGLSVSYQSSNTAVATVSGSTVTIRGAGTTTITASQSGNTQYNAATSVEQTLTVNKADQTISFGTLSDTKFSENTLDLTSTATSGLTVSYESSNTSVATVSSNTVTFVDVGTVTITASQSGNNDYNAATSVGRSLTIIKGDQTIPLDPIPDKEINSADFDLPQTTTAGLDIFYSSSNTGVATVSGNTVSIVGEGTTNITASQSGNTQYNAATTLMESLTVTKLSQTINEPSFTATSFGDAKVAVYLTATSGLPLTIESSDESIVTFDPIADVGGGSFRTYLNPVGAGDVTITVSQAGNATYQSASETYAYSVSKADQSITFGTLNDVEVIAEDFDLGATASSSLDVSYSSSNPSVASVTTDGTVSVASIGTTTITASQSGNSNFNAATSVQRTLTVTKADQYIIFGTLPTKSYGDPAFNLTATATSDLPVTYSSGNTSIATVDGNTLTIVGVGLVTITAYQAGDGSYTAATPVDRMLTVDKASQSITFSALPEKSYGDPDFDLTASATSGLSVNYESSNTSVATVSSGTVNIVGVGTTNITASQAGNENYEAATSVQQALVVGKSDQIIEFAEITSKEIGSDPFDLTGNASSGLTVNYSSSDESVATISGSTVTIVGVGTTTITASQAGNGNYNPAVNKTQDFTVTLLQQTITFGELENRAYGDADFDLSATSSSGLDVSFSSSDETIASITGSTITIKKAGSVTITASQSGNDSYASASSVERTLTIDKADQTVTFGALTQVTEGDPDFELSATVSSGLAVSYFSSDENIASVDGSTVTIVAAGKATISAFQAGNNDYNPSDTVSQELIVDVATVEKSQQTITFNAISSKTYGDADFDLVATASSDLAVAFSSSDESILMINGNTATIVSAGTVSITASQSGNDSFEAASTAQDLVVNKANQQITFEETSSLEMGTEITLNATATSGLEVSFEISGPGILNGATITPESAGTITVTALQPGNDNYNAAEPVTLSIDVLESVISALEPTSQVIIYPNPTSDYLMFSGLASEATIVIFDLSGSKILSSKFQGDRIPVKSLQEGHYLIQIQSVDNQEFKRIIIERN